MSPIITQPVAPAHAHLDEAAHRREERLAEASAEQLNAALAYLSSVDPVTFSAVMDAADILTGTAPTNMPDGASEAVPVCGRCDAQIGVFLHRGEDWTHFLGDGTTAGAQEVYDPGHPAQLAWHFPDQGPQQP